MRRSLLVTTATLVALAPSACASDALPSSGADTVTPTATAESSAATSPTSTPPISTPPTVAASAGGGADLAAFCDAKRTFDAVDNNTPDEAAFDRYVAESTAAAQVLTDVAPGELRPAVTTLVASLSRLDTREQGTAAHSDAAYARARGELATAVHERCAFGQLAITIEDDAYVDVPVAPPSGPTSLLVDNRDRHVHPTIIARLADDVTPEQLLQNPELFETAATVSAVVVAGPAASDGAIIDLTPGTYIVFDPEHLESGMALSVVVPT
jgi:hypothetical protein